MRAAHSFGLLALLCAASASAQTKVQACTAIDDSGATSTTIACTMAGNTTAGNLLVAGAGYSGAIATATASGCGATWNNSGSSHDPTNDQAFKMFYAFNVPAQACTVTITFDTARGFRRLIGQEWNTISTTAPADGNAANFQASPGITTDAVTSTAITTTANGDLIVGFAQDTGEASPGTGTISAGTGYTAEEQAGTNVFRAESRIQGSAGSIAATFTLSSNGPTASGIMAFKASGGAPAPMGMNKRRKLETMDDPGS